LIANGHDVAVLEHHVSTNDPMANIYSEARSSYYGVEFIPDAFFDGVINLTGAYTYPTYLTKVNQRLAIPSSFTISINSMNNGLDYTMEIDIENVETYAGTNIVLQFVVTESDVYEGGTHYNFVTRYMDPNQNGTPLDFSGSSTQSVTLEFSADPSWVIENCEIVAFVQDNSTKEILQGTKKFLLIPQYDIDAKAKAVKHPKGLFCGNTVEPIVVIKNMGGTENLASVDIEYSINGGTPETYSWSGDLGFNLDEEVTLPEISFVPNVTNTFEFSVSNPNGQPDPNPDNNTISEEFDVAPQIPTATVNFELKTDLYPEETSWEVTNSSGQVIYSGGPYTGQANTTFNEIWEFNEYDCYKFTIFDAFGDGICCSYGIGYYKIMDENNTILLEGGEFGAEENKPFERYDENTVSADFMADLTFIVEGESVNFTDLSAGNITTWSWEFEGGDPATSSEQNPTVMYALEGLYDVTLTVSNATSSNTMVKEDYIEVDHITGIPNNNEFGINVFPNPSTGIVFIEGAENANIKVYNTAGTVVASFNEFSNNSIDLTQLENGIYFIKIIIENETINKKINLIK